MKSKLTRTVLMVLLLLGATYQSSAQTQKELAKHREKVLKSLERKQAVISLDTLFYLGEAVCLAVKEGGGIIGGPNYLFKSFEGIELIYCKYEANINGNKSEPYYSYNFFETGLKAEDPYVLMVDKPFEKIAKKGLIVLGKTDSAAVKRFVMVVGNPFSNVQNQTQTLVLGQTQPQFVERNRQGMIMIMGNDILQSNTKIGYFTKKSELKNGGGIVYVTLVYLPNGSLIAQATSADLHPESVQVITIRDNRSHEVNTAFGSDIKDISTYLIANYYL